MVDSGKQRSMITLDTYIRTLPRLITEIFYRGTTEGANVVTLLYPAFQAFSVKIMPLVTS